MVTCRKVSLANSVENGKQRISGGFGNCRGNDETEVMLGIAGMETHQEFSAIVCECRENTIQSSREPLNREPSNFRTATIGEARYRHGRHRWSLEAIGETFVPRR